MCDLNLTEFAWLKLKTLRTRNLSRYINMRILQEIVLEGFNQITAKLATIQQPCGKIRTGILRR
jgi:hypothetical protein